MDLVAERQSGEAVLMVDGKGMDEMSVRSNEEDIADSKSQILRRKTQ